MPKDERKTIPHPNSEEKAYFLQAVGDIVPVTVMLLALPSREVLYLNRADNTVSPVSDAKKEFGLPVPGDAGPFSPEALSAIEAFYERFYLLKDEEENHLEYRIRHKAGQWIYFSARGKVYQRDADNKAIQALIAIQDITQQRAAEQELLRFKEKATHQAGNGYFHLFQSVNQGFCIVDVVVDERQQPVGYRLLETNPAFEKQALLKNAFGAKERREPGEEAFWLRVCGEIIGTGRAQSFEYYRTQSGNGIWYEVYAFNADRDQPHRVALLFHEITSRKQVEKTLRESEAKYRTLFDSVDEGYCIIQMIYDEAGKATDWRFLQTNRAFELNNGLYNAEGKTIRALAPDIEEKWMTIYDGVARSGIPLRFEEESAALKRIFSLYAFRVGYAGERKVAVIFTDITKRKQAEQKMRERELQYRTHLEAEVRERTAELQQSRDLLQSVFDTTQIQMSILEVIRDEAGAIADLKIKVANKELERATGRTDLVGKHYAEEYPGIKQSGLFDLIVKTIETGEPQHTEYFYPYNGGYKWYSCMLVKLGDGVVASNLDISARREAEMQLKRMELEQQQEIVKATFTALEEERSRISESLHNGLGQVLYGVKLSLDNLTPERAINDPGGFREDHQYTDKLLAQSIREARHIAHELMPVILNDHGLKVAIQDICNQFRDGISITCRIKGSTKGLDKYLELAIYRIVQELVVNIMKHAGATRGTILIDIERIVIHIGVKDNGRGIRDDDRDQASGIGFSSIRAKISLLNGKMKIISNPGKGTGVYIDIPNFGNIDKHGNADEPRR